MQRLRDLSEKAEVAKLQDSLRSEFKEKEDLRNEKKLLQKELATATAALRKKGHSASDAVATQLQTLLTEAREKKSATEELLRESRSREKTLEREKEGLALNLDDIQRALSSAEEEAAALRKRVQEVEQDVLFQRSRADSLESDHERSMQSVRELTDAKDSMQKSLRRAHDRLSIRRPDKVDVATEMMTVGIEHGSFSAPPFIPFVDRCSRESGFDFTTAAPDMTAACTFADEATSSDFEAVRGRSSLHRRELAEISDSADLHNLIRHHVSPPISPKPNQLESGVSHESLGSRESLGSLSTTLPHESVADGLDQQTSKEDERRLSMDLDCGISSISAEWTSIEQASSNNQLPLHQDLDDLDLERLIATSAVKEKMDALSSALAHLGHGANTSHICDSTDDLPVEGSPNARTVEMEAAAAGETVVGSVEQPQMEPAAAEEAVRSLRKSFDTLCGLTANIASSLRAEASDNLRSREIANIVRQKAQEVADQLEIYGDAQLQGCVSQLRLVQAAVKADVSRPRLGSLSSPQSRGTWPNQTATPAASRQSISSSHAANAVGFDMEIVGRRVSSPVASPSMHSLADYSLGADASVRKLTGQVLAPDRHKAFSKPRLSTTDHSSSLPPLTDKDRGSLGRAASRTRRASEPNATIQPPVTGRPGTAQTMSDAASRRASDPNATIQPLRRPGTAQTMSVRASVRSQPQTDLHPEVLSVHPEPSDLPQASFTDPLLSSSSRISRTEQPDADQSDRHLGLPLQIKSYSRTPSPSPCAPTPRVTPSWQSSRDSSIEHSPVRSPAEPRSTSCPRRVRHIRETRAYLSPL
jgi:hypothetical protein